MVLRVGGAGGAGGVAVSAGTNSASSGTIVFSNSNGITFGQDTNGVVTASVAGTVAGGTAVVNFSAGTTSGALSNVVFSNSNSVSFGLNGSTITASVSQNNQAVSAANGSYSFQTLSFSNANGISFGTSAGSAVTASYTVPAATVFSNSNNVSFGLAGSTVTATATFAQTNQSEGMYAIGNTTGQSSSSTFDARTMSISGAGAVSVGYSGNALVISAAAGGQSAQTMGLYGSSQTVGESSSSTIDARSLTIVGQGGVSVGMSAGSLLISGGAGGGGGVAMSAGTQSVSTGTMVFSNSNNITFGMSGSSRITASFSQTNQVNNVFAVSNTTQSTSGTIDARSLSFQGAGGVSVGVSNGSVVISGGAGSAQTVGVYAVSNTTQSSSGTLDARSMSFNAYGMISAGYSNGSIVISGPDTTSLPVASVGFSTGGNTAGTTGFGTDQVVFAGGANITLSGSTNAGSMTISVVGGAGGGGVAISAGTQSVSTGTMVFSNSNNVTFGMSGSSRITASFSESVQTQSNVQGIIVSNTTYRTGDVSFSNANGITFGSSGANVVTASYTVPTQTAQSMGLYALGNTTQNSSTTLDARTLSFNALGAMTMGYSNGSIQVSAPPVSSLVGAGGISLSSNGSTVTISYTNATKSGISPYADLAYEMTQIGQGVMIIDPMSMPDVQFDRVVVPVYNTNSSNSSGSHTLSFWAGLYSRNASTLSRYGSASGSFAVTHSGTQGVYASLSGLRALTIPWTTTVAAGQYWFALISRTTSGGADGSYSHLRVSAGIATNLAGMFSAATNASVQMTLGQGSFSATTAGMPSSIAFSDIQGTGSSVFRAPVVWLASSTV